ncbi:MAG TPA: TRAP transporter small permease [Syntrophorhabdaceae bacterium]|nr:TRAP transporter small permease [Syntrophorhabdaceae bacterium]
MARIERFIQRTIRYGTFLAVAVMGGVLILIVATAIGRLLGYTIPGTFDVVETFMMAVGAFCLAYCESLGAQAKAEVIIDRVSSRARSCLEVFTTLLTTLYWVIIFYAGWKVLLVKFARGEKTDLLGVNVVPSRTLWITAVFLMCSFLILRFLHHIKDAAKGTMTKGVSR